jgi:hypothetical protein
MKISKQELLSEYRSGLIDVAPMDFRLPDFNPFRNNFNYPKNTPIFNYSSRVGPLPNPFASKNKPEEKYTSPLYNPVAPQPSKVVSYAPRTASVAPQGGEYSTSYTVNPTIQQRLKLTGTGETDTTLSRKERGVPLDKSSELVGAATGKPKGTWMNLTRTVFNPNYRQDLMRASSVVPTMVTKYTTFYDRIFKPAEEEED